MRRWESDRSDWSDGSDGGDRNIQTKQKANGIRLWEISSIGSNRVWKIKNKRA